MALPGRNTREYQTSPSRVEDDVYALYDQLENKREEFYSSASHHATMTHINDYNFDDIKFSFHQTSQRIQNRFMKIEAIINSWRPDTKKKNRRKMIAVFANPLFLFLFLLPQTQKQNLLSPQSPVLIHLIS